MYYHTYIQSFLNIANHRACKKNWQMHRECSMASCANNHRQRHLYTASNNTNWRQTASLRITSGIIPNAYSPSNSATPNVKCTSTHAVANGTSNMFVDTAKT